MVIRYAILKVNEGYLCNNDDCCGGWAYDQIIDEHTILFISKGEAELNCDNGEVVVELEI